MAKKASLGKEWGVLRLVVVFAGEARSQPTKHFVVGAFSSWPSAALAVFLDGILPGSLSFSLSLGAMPVWSETPFLCGTTTITITITTTEEEEEEKDGRRLYGQGVVFFFFSGMGFCDISLALALTFFFGDTL